LSKHRRQKLNRRGDGVGLFNLKNKSRKQQIGRPKRFGTEPNSLDLSSEKTVAIAFFLRSRNWEGGVVKQLGLASKTQGEFF